MVLRIPRWLTTVLGVLAMANAGSAFAQDSLRRLEFSFSNPGARSMGFGGAFVALADDPTAAFANPGGLIPLARPEVFLDIRLGFEATERSDTFGFTEGATDYTSLSFISAVYPLSRCSIAAYSHQMVKADISYINEVPDSDPLLALDLTRYAVAGACRLLDELSLGVGVSYFDASFKILEQTEKSTDWGINAGLLWHAHERLSFGAFYREGPGLEVANGSAGTLTLPDAYGLGGAVRSANGRFTISAEWDRVEWSAMYRGLNAVALGSQPTQLVDVDEIHLGAEYAWITSSKVIALRFGAWRDPDHVAQHPDGEEDRTRYHGAAGLGVAWRHFQLDLAIDASSDVFTFSASGMYVF